MSVYSKVLNNHPLAYKYKFETLSDANSRLETISAQLDKSLRKRELESLQSEVADIALFLENGSTGFEKSETLRSFTALESITDTIITKAGELRGRGKAREGRGTDVTERAKNVLTRYEEAITATNPNIMQVIREYKDHYDEKELVDLKDKEQKSLESKITDNQKQKGEIDTFVGQFDSSEIDRYLKSEKILGSIKTLEKAQKDIEKAERELQRLMAVPARDEYAVRLTTELIAQLEQEKRELQAEADELRAIDPRDEEQQNRLDELEAQIATMEGQITSLEERKVELEHIPVRNRAPIDKQEQIISQKKAEIEKASATLRGFEMLGATRLIESDGTVNSSALSEFVNRHKNPTQEMQENSSRRIATAINIGILKDKGELEVAKFFDRLGVKLKFPTSADRVEYLMNNMDKITTAVKGQQVLSAKKKIEIDGWQKDREEIQSFINQIRDERGERDEEESDSSGGSGNNGYRYNQSYRELLSKIDKVYGELGEVGKQKERYRYLLRTMKPRAFFKRTRAFFRSFTKNSEEGMYRSRKVEREAIRRETAFNASLKVVETGDASDVGEARVMGMRKADVMYLSGNPGNSREPSGR